MMYFDLPTSLEIGGEEWVIRTDYRIILSILAAYDDPDLEDKEKIYVCLYNLYEDFENLPQELYREAFEAAMGFIDHGNGDSNGHRAKNMDWEQDANLLFPAVNKVAGYEVRSVEYLHWWTFLGFFMEIGEGAYSTVLSLRSKKNSGKKLEKWESEWWTKNQSICKLKKKYSEAEKVEQDAIKAILGPR